MLHHIDHWRSSRRWAVLFATASSVVLAGLVWTVNRDLLWMLAVLLPPVWVSVLAQPTPRAPIRSDDDPTDQLAIAGLSIGLAVLFTIGLLVFFLM